MGVKVRATKEEIMTAPDTTILNSLNNLPVNPSKKTIGKKTATRVMVVEIIANMISFDPSIPACTGDKPSSIRLYTFSVITMASSTTKPTDNTTANIERTLIEKSAKYMMKNVPISDTGIATIGIKVTRQSRKNKKIIRITKRKAI